MNGEVRYIGIGLITIVILLFSMVGSVAETSLDPKSYDAVVKLSIKPYDTLPKDTVAVIATVGIIRG
jgi:hypothetical protein